MVEYLQAAWEGFVRVMLERDMIIAMGFVCFLFAIDALRRGIGTTFSKKAIAGSLTSFGCILSNFFFVPIIFAGVEILQGVYDQLGIPVVSREFWGSIPYWMAGIIAVAMHDFVDYWNHRFMHFKLLWPIHAIHHSDEEVNGLTTFRVHFLEALFMKLTYIVGLSWLGITPEAAAFGGIILGVHNIYVHSNNDWDHGIFKFFLASPRFHRWHHANEPKAYGKNLANVIPAWDYIFGTYYNPGICRAPMGADGVPHADLVALMLFPFAQWKRDYQKAKQKREALKKTQNVQIDAAE